MNIGGSLPAAKFENPLVVDMLTGVSRSGLPTPAAAACSARRRACPVALFALCLLAATGALYEAAAGETTRLADASDKPASQLLIAPKAAAPPADEPSAHPDTTPLPEGSPTPSPAPLSALPPRDEGPRPDAPRETALPVPVAAPPAPPKSAPPATQSVPQWLPLPKRVPTPAAPPKAVAPTTDTTPRWDALAAPPPTPAAPTGSAAPGAADTQDRTSLPDRQATPAAPPAAGAPALEPLSVPEPLTPRLATPAPTATSRDPDDAAVGTPPAAAADPAAASGPSETEASAAKAAALPTANIGAATRPIVSILFPPGSAELSGGGQAALNSLAARLEEEETLRVELLAYAAGDGRSGSRPRRLSLSRAQVVRSYLTERGIATTRIYIRALGDKVEAGPPDRVDVRAQGR